VEQTSDVIVQQDGLELHVLLVGYIMYICCIQSCYVCTNDIKQLPTYTLSHGEVVEVYIIIK
jgi:hypothetical protein